MTPIRRFDYRLIDADARGDAVGVIVLQADEVLEPELPAWLADPALGAVDQPALSIRLYHTRIPSGADLTPDSLLAMHAALPEAAARLPATAGIRVVAYGCTSGTTLIGEDAVSDAVHSVLPGVHVTNPLTATRRWLQAQDCHRIALLTPYIPSVTEALCANLASHGIHIVHCGSYYEQVEARVCRIEPASILDSLLALGADPTCDAVFASCTNLRTLPILAGAARRLGKPVISSNAALAWDIARLLRNPPQ